MRRARTIVGSAVLALVITVAAACMPPSDDPRPVEIEQIEGLVADYIERDAATPDYAIELVGATERWAQVRVRPREVENDQPVYVYLRKNGLPADAVATLPPESPEDDADGLALRTASGWTIVLGPQARFEAGELDELGVPDELRP